MFGFALDLQQESPPMRAAAPIPPPPIVEYASVKEAARLTTLSTKTIRDAINAGKLESRRYGRRIMVPLLGLDALLKPNAGAAR